MVGATGTTTIEYEDSSALGFGEDFESQYIIKNGGRLRSFHPRNQVSSRLTKTIDENLILNRMVAGTKQMLRREGLEESVEDRMRIFEDEIIKRIKVIQSFVKNLDGKVNRLRANQKVTDSSRKNNV